MYVRILTTKSYVNTLRPRQNWRYFADDIFNCIFLNENVWIPINISLKFVPKGPINSIPALVQIMAWRRLGDKPLFEPMMARLKTQICVIRPQWVKCMRYPLWFLQQNTSGTPIWYFCLRLEKITKCTYVFQKLVAVFLVCLIWCITMTWFLCEKLMWKQSSWT